MNTKPILVFLLISTLLIAISGCRLSVRSDILGAISEANKEYEAGNYQQALESYSSLLGKEKNSPQLYYNIANTEYRLENFPLAIYYYRKALHLDPGNPDAKANLKLAREKIENGISYDQERWLLDYSLILNRHLNRAELRVLFIASFSILLLLIFFRNFNFRLRGWAHSILIAMTLTTFVSSFFAAEDGSGNPKFYLPYFTPWIRSAVATDGPLQVHSGNADTFQVILVLPAGSEVETKESRVDWIAVELPGNKRGWIKKEDVKFI